MNNIDPSTQNYINILEKTNQQLSLWYNPYGIMVTVLTALIALLAIAFGFILWRQGKEYKDAFKIFLDEQKKFADGELKKSISEAKIVFDEQIGDKLKELKDLKGQARNDIEKEITKLQKARESLENSSVHMFSGGAPSNICSGVLGLSEIYNNSLSLGNLNNPLENSINLNLPTCPACGSLSYFGSRFCAKCGTKLA